jgi:hypothetical protein
MEEFIVKLSLTEKAALQVLARRSKRTLEQTILRIVLVELLKEGLINESAERDGSKFMRLDE